MSKKLTVVYIDGYWAEDGEAFENYKCIVGEWDGNLDDTDIFYHFESIKEIKSFVGDFIVTDWKIGAKLPICY